MKLSDFLCSPEFDVNAVARIFAGGQWDGEGLQVATFSCGTFDRCMHGMLDAPIKYVTVDEDGRIIIEIKGDVTLKPASMEQQGPCTESGA